MSKRDIMLKTMKTLRKLDDGYCFVPNGDGTISILAHDKKTIPDGALMSKSPRVRMLGTRLGDEKSNSYKDIRAEFSWHVFPSWAFYYDPEALKIQVGFTEYYLNASNDVNPITASEVI